MLTGAQKATVRRLLGYPAIGILRVSPGGQALANANQGFRYFQAYGRLEFIMNNLQPYEEAQLFGKAVGAIFILGNTTPGDTVSVVISGAGLLTPVTLTVTAGVGDTPVSLSNALAAKALQNTNLIGAGFMSVTPYGTGPFAQNAVPLPEVAFFNAKAFMITTSATGNTGSAVADDSNGSIVQDPSALVDPTTDPPTVLNGYVPILLYLEGTIAGSTQNLDTSKADVWTARHDEPEIRVQLFNYWQNKMAELLEVPPWRDFGDHRAGTPHMVARI